MDELSANSLQGSGGEDVMKWVWLSGMLHIDMLASRQMCGSVRVSGKLSCYNRKRWYVYLNEPRRFAIAYWGGKKK